MFLLSPLRCYLAPPLFFFRSVDCTLTNLLARALFVRASLAFVDSAGELRLFVACCLLFVVHFVVFRSWIGSLRIFTLSNRGHFVCHSRVCTLFAALTYLLRSMAARVPF